MCISQVLLSAVLHHVSTFHHSIALGLTMAALHMTEACLATHVLLFGLNKLNC